MPGDKRPGGGPGGERGGPGPGDKRPGGGSGIRKPGGPGGRKGPGPAGAAFPLLLRLLSYLKYYRGLLAVVLSVSVLTAVLELFPPWIIRLSVDRFVLADAGTRLVWVAAGLMILAMVHGATDFLRLYLTAQLGQQAVFRIRTALFAHLSRLSFSFYDSARTGDLVIRTTDDVDTLSQFFGRAATIILTNILFLIGILVVLLTWDWRLAIVYLALLPFIGAGMYLYARKVRPAMGRVEIRCSSVTPMRGIPVPTWTAP